MTQRVVVRRRLRQAGEERGLDQRQVRGGPREVRPGSSLGAERVVAVEHRVQIGLQDPALWPGMGERDGQARLGQLPPQRHVLPAEVAGARELLGDGRASLHDPARADVGDRRPRDPGVVEGAVAPEAPVLDRDGRDGQPARHPVQRDGLTVLARRYRAQP
jgi:hypothetical protein